MTSKISNCAYSPYHTYKIAIRLYRGCSKAISNPHREQEIVMRTGAVHQNHSEATHTQLNISTVISKDI